MSELPILRHMPQMKRATNAKSAFRIDPAVTELSIVSIVQWQALSEAIKASESLEKIIVLDTTTEQQTKAMYEALDQHLFIETLIFDDMRYDSEISKWLAKLIESNTSIYRLELNSRSQLGQPEELPDSIMKALKNNRSVQWLALSKVAFSLRTPVLKDLLTENNTIVKLVLNRNTFPMKQLLDGLRANRTIKFLEIGNSGLNDDCFQALSDVMRTHPSIRTLNLTVLSQHAPACYQWLGEALKQNTALKTLKLESELHSWITDHNVQYLADGLKMNGTLTALRINALFSETGTVCIAQAIKNNPSITELDLARNQIRELGAKAIAETLKVNPNISVLDISSCEINESGMNDIFDMIQTNQALTAIDLTNNVVTHEMAEKLLCEVLQKNTSLLSVDVIIKTSVDGSCSDSPLSEKQQSDLEAIIERNMMLQYERTVNLLVLFFNIARDPQVLPKDIWRLIFSYYRIPGIASFESILNEVFTDCSIRRIHAMDNF